MQTFRHFVSLTAPLSLLVLVGYILARWRHWPKEVADGITRFVFSVALPAFLFRLMSNFFKLPRVDARLLLAFFGGCLLVFILGRTVARIAFRMDGEHQSLFALGGIFSNNALLGVPLASVSLGPAAMPSVSLVLGFNALVLWTLVTVSIEWARYGSISWGGILRTGRATVLNPLVASILLGTAVGSTGLSLPMIADRTLELLSQATLPLSLVALGMSLAQFSVDAHWKVSAAVTLLKLVVQPSCVWMLAYLLSLPVPETQAVVLMASLPVGANVYLMSKHFGMLEGPIAASLVISTALAASTVPAVLACIGAGNP